jgi:hypothetical protein
MYKKIVNQESSSYLLVMTACVNPASQLDKRFNFQRIDPILRLQDYKEALQYWLNYSDPRITKILFIENSGYRLDEIQKFYQQYLKETDYPKEVEFISLNCNEIPTGVHYGYAELSMLDEGLSRSKLLPSCQYIIKVTGRLIFPSLSKLLNLLPKSYDLCVDCRRNSLFVKSKQEFIVTQLMIFSRQFYKANLENIKCKLSTETPHIERMLYLELIKYEDSPGKVLRWKINVDPVGYAAHSGNSYQSLNKYLASLIRYVARRLFPKWWF